MKKLLVVCLPLLLLSGCFALPTEAPVMMPPAVVIRGEPSPFRLFPVSRGDVRNTADPIAQFGASAEASVSFSIGGMPIYGIFVVVGDIVQEGDLIASLYFPELAEEIEELTLRSNDIRMRLSHAHERHGLALSLAETSGNPIDDSQYLNNISDLSGELEILEWYLRTLFEEDAIRHIWAPISGVITHATTFVEDMRSTAGARIAVISDPAPPFFVVRTAADVRLMNLGDRVDMSVGEYTFLMEVVDPEEQGLHRRPEWSVAAFLMFVDGPPAFLTSNIGRVHMTFGEVFDVIYIHINDLRQAGTRYFVYLYEDGIRVTRDVLPGLRGNHTVEIISGLEEGELIVR